jgi:anti-sigma factor RsiW
LTRPHEDYQAEVGAYLLGALSELEIEAFERHVMGCASCRDELERLRVAADALPRSVTQLNPPPGLKDSLMREVVQGAKPAKSRGFGLRMRIRPTYARMRPTMAWASAAFILFVGVLAGAGVVAALNGGDDARTVAARVDRVRVPDGSASLMIPSRGGDPAVLRVQGMPKLPNGLVYEVWVKRGNDVVPESLFTVSKDGGGAAAVPDGVHGASQVMVTRERAGGVSSPTGAPILTVGI